MFWRFGGYANISTLDSILEKPDVTPEEVLEESDLIQELKQHNTKLLEFLRDEKVLKKLLEHVIAHKPAPLPPKKDGVEGDEQSEGYRAAAEAERDKDEKARLKYAHVSCEVLSSETWSLLGALMANISLLRGFWSFLDREPPLDPLQASYFTKVNETLLDKKTEEMMAFVRGLRGIVPKILRHVDCPMIMDLLLKIISMEKCEGGAGIVDWLHSQNLIPLLLSFLSNKHSASTQTASGDFIKALITISANASQNEQSCIGPNDLTRQLVSYECVTGLINDMLKGGNPLTVGVGIVIEVIRKNNSDYDPDIGTGVESIPSSRDPIYLGTLLRLFASHVPDFMNLVLSQGTVTVTNDDGTKKEVKRELKVAFGGAIEPLGFDRFKTCELMAELLHCSNMGLLNEKGGERYVKDRDRERDRLKAERLLVVEGLGDSGGGAEGVVVEKAPLQVQNGGIEMSDDGLNEEEFEDVIVSDMLEEAIEGHTNLDKKDYCEDGFAEEPLPLLSPTAPGEITASSSTAAAGTAPQDISTPVGAPISADDILTPNEPLAGVVAAADVPLPADNEVPELAEDNDADTGEAPPPLPPKDDGSAPAREVVLIEEEVPVPKAPSPLAAEGADETDQETGRSVVGHLEPETVNLSPLNPNSAAIFPEEMDEELPSLPTSGAVGGVSQNAPQPEEENLMDLNSTPDTTIAEGDISVRSLGSVGSSITEYQAMIEPDLDGNPVVGDYLKMMFVEHKVVPTILDFFFRFPWNNFLHNVVYDVVQQVFNGPMDRGYNRALAIDLFVTGRITEKIVDGQRCSDKFETEQKMRLGYMGHLTLVAEEVVKFAERHPPEILGHKVLEKVSDPVWIDYVEDTLATTRERDNAILGGVRPDMHLGPRIGGLSSAQAQVFAGGTPNAAQLALGGGLDSIDLGTNGGGGGNAGTGGGLLSGFGSSSDEEDDDMEHDDEDEEVARLGLSGTSDQFESYISQEITNVDKFGSSDEEDDDDDDMSFSAAPSEPPPPPPLPLNIKRAQHRTQIEDAEKEAEGAETLRDFEDSSDEDDMIGDLLARRGINSTHEAKIRELLEDEDEDFMTEGVRALNIRSLSTTGESREIAPGEFYGPKKQDEPANEELSEKTAQKEDEILASEDKQEVTSEKA